MEAIKRTVPIKRIIKTTIKATTITKIKTKTNTKTKIKNLKKFNNNNLQIQLNNKPRHRAIITHKVQQILNSRCHYSLRFKLLQILSNLHQTQMKEEL
jgi:hypothetical protein